MKEQLLQKAKPIIFNTEMVKAILEGKKTQFRKPILKDFMKVEIEKNVMPQEVKFLDFKRYCPQLNFKDNGNAVFQLINRTRKPLPFCDGVARHIDVKPKYKVGDILWVRETFAENFGIQKRVVYKAEFNNDAPLSIKWKPSIHMPKKYARIFLKVTNIRVERLQDISVLDAIKEGCPKEYFDGKIGTKEQVKDWWINLWNSTAKDGYKWEDNPYVFVYEFERIENVN